MGRVSTIAQMSPSVAARLTVNALRLDFSCLLEDLSRGRTAQSRREGRLYISRSGIQWRPNGSEAPPLLLEIGSSLSEWTRGLAAQGIKNVAIALGPGRAIIETIHLPRVDRDRLEAILANKIESLAPWPLEQAVWGYRLRQSEELNDRQVVVDVGITGRSFVDETIALLEANGLTVTAVDVTDEKDSAPGILIDFDREGRNTRIRQRMGKAATACGILLVLAFSFGIYGLISSTIAAGNVEARIDAIQARLARAGASASAQDMRSEVADLISRKRSENAFIDVLETLSATLPDTVYLETLDVADKQLTIGGHGALGLGTIEDLEKSPTLSNVNFASATQRNIQDASEAFSLRATIDPRTMPP